MYLNGLSSITKNDILFFADDSSLHASHNTNNFEDVRKTLQQDLNRIRNYGNDWIVTFNATKTSQQTFSHKVAPIIPALTFDSIVIPVRDNHKHLGVTISSDLRFKSHVNQILLKFNRTLSPLYPISNMLPRHILLHIYKMYVRPHLDYCDTIYDSHLTAADKSRLEKAQNRAARLITATPRRTPTAGLREELGWSSLETRRHNHKLHLYHKIMYEPSIPEFIKEIVPNFRQTDSERCTRSTQCNLITMPIIRTSSFARSFIPTTTKLWNRLPNDLRGETSFKLFKTEINSLTNTGNPIQYLSLGSKLGNMLHTQIRLNCSELNEHKSKLGKIDSPKCRCGANREDTTHYLLSCPLFNAEREEMMKHISAILNKNFRNFPQKLKLKILLYGPQEGRAAEYLVASALQRFVQLTRRFVKS